MSVGYACHVVMFTAFQTANVTGLPIKAPSAMWQNQLKPQHIGAKDDEKRDKETEGKNEDEKN